LPPDAYKYNVEVAVSLAEANAYIPSAPIDKKRPLMPPILKKAETAVSYRLGII